MNIDLSMIAKSINMEMDVTVEFSPVTFQSRLGVFPITDKTPVTLHIRNEENETVLINGTVELEVMIPCARCLADVRTPVHFDIKKQLRVADGSAPKGENAAKASDSCMLLDDEMEETDYMTGFELDADRLIYDEILVNWPMKVLCKDDCKGICRVCGMNLNKGACSCQRTEPDPRMAAIQDIFNKFKEV